MQDLNYWKQFESTGKIQDYLSYCACVSQEANGHENTSAEEMQEQSGVNPYAGYSMCNRNRVETDAYR